GHLGYHGRHTDGPRSPRAARRGGRVLPAHEPARGAGAGAVPGGRSQHFDGLATLPSSPDVIPDLIRDLQLACTAGLSPWGSRLGGREGRSRRLLARSDRSYTVSWGSKHCTAVARPSKSVSTGPSRRRLDKLSFFWFAHRSSSTADGST